MVYVRGSRRTIYPNSAAPSASYIPDSSIYLSVIAAARPVKVPSTNSTTIVDFMLFFIPSFYLAILLPRQD
ncbi:hypothetical protein EO98_02555 [Methanosarcina sp. 2.H.T.1A.6]|uniref:hypothetical protein n=1 Tax=unclassified Methanosarcina TaxID=2644672 RepID=UPI00062159F3|nr:MULTISPECIES: hypothetical protein [unclassified Methanosarcina]KKG18509.1 hypothetical protein EO94_04885 [Methanosarcina sp. 2.H.T.1A.3]KKG21164.1 hypothetical protein EO96_01395 [Methanosarcina sp. 2.H.T.1A.8]KKG22214.1 hypothetical protein EO97_06360 [Methanosarcina sp. 2.H.T.1A.15]KKG22322.1 hypothetical protein EO98_02555 [Methanosarcina sp. 2.H.T.1A.6]